MIASKFLLVCLIILCGCIKNKSEKSLTFHMSKDEHETLKQECGDISSNGNILALLSEIKMDTRKIFKLLESSNPTVSREMITLLADGISDKSKKVITLSAYEWTMDRWSYEIHWEINEGDFRENLGTQFRNGFQVLDHKIDSIYFMGEQREDLKDKISIKERGNNLVITFKSLGSSLEICQLQRSLTLVLEVGFRNIRTYKKRYFNLNVQSDLMESL